MNSSYLFAILSGLLLGIAFPPSQIGLLSLIAYVPILYAISLNAPNWSRGKSVLLTYLMFFAYHGIGNWWVSSWQEQTDPFLFWSGIALALFHPFFLAAPILVLIYLRKKLGTSMSLAAAPFAIAGFEWLHGQSDASYPWLTTGYSLIDTPLAQAADLIGVYGLSFLIVVVNTTITAMIVRKNLSGKNGLQTKSRTFTPAIMLLGLLIVWFSYGVSQQDQVRNDATLSPLKVALIQPNENPWDKWADPRLQVRKHLQLSNVALNRGVKPDLVVWSETAIPYTIMEPGVDRDWVEIQHWADTANVSLLSGYAQRMVYPPNQAPASARYSTADSTIRYDTFNAAFMVNPNSTKVQSHQKSMLTPFAERIPFADQLSFAMKWVEWGVGISAWGKGLTRVPLECNGAKLHGALIAPIICIESIYPEVAMDFVHNGATILCVTTNDAWYNGTSGPRQHYSIARMRAIEQRRWLFRVGNSGISGIIDANGKSVQEVPAETTTALIGVVQQCTQTTVYSKIGNFVAEVSLYITLVLLTVARFGSLFRKMQARFNQ